VALTTHHHLAPRSRKEYSYTSTPPCAFMAGQRLNFTFALLDCVYAKKALYTTPCDATQFPRPIWTRSNRITIERDRCLYACSVRRVNSWKLLPGAVLSKKKNLNLQQCNFMVLILFHNVNILIILTQATQRLLKCAGLVLLCQNNSLAMAPRCRNT
jgi:hypothetical protein